MKSSVLLIAILGLFASALSQTVTVSEPVVIGQQTRDLKPPRFRIKDLPAYPANLGQDGPAGFALINVRISEKGAISGIPDVVTSDNKFREAVGDVRKWKFTPAESSGKAVASVCQITVIFNSDKSDPTNRPAQLLDLKIPATPKTLLETDPPRSMGLHTTIRVDETGAAGVTEILLDDPGEKSPETFRTLLHANGDDILNAFKKMPEGWKFSPATKDGKPVASSFPLELWFLNERLAGDRVAPTIVEHARLEYPESMRQKGNNGEVLIEFIVDINGNAKNPRIVKSSHPAFEDPAIKAILKSRFKAGTIEGRPVDMRMSITMRFGLKDRGIFGNFEEGSGTDAYAISAESSKRLPPSLQFDQPPKATLVVLPVYPMELLKKKKTGKAKVAVYINTDGEVEKVKILEASEPEFGKALAAAAFNWTYQPAMRNKKVTATILGFEQDFDDYGRDAPVDSEGESILKAWTSDPKSIPSLKELDAVPKAVFRVGPAVPPGVQSGTVLVEFFIDANGKTQIPHALSADSEDLVYPALTAVSRWRFEPPMKGGKAVRARAQIPIAFTAPVETAPPKMEPIPEATKSP